ncbi:MAG TPA: hypothetical protein VMD30_11990 [Tepidisphaeraceae bacterium]|nr:hypothetical protein [Tepidisphaeraceae bacterium]
MKRLTRTALAWLLCMGVATTLTITAGCYDHDHGYAHEEYVDVHGYHHEGYYDANHNWHGGYYDENHQYHQDASDWHQ